MTAKKEMKRRYFEWMCQLVCDNRYFSHEQHSKLLRYLDDRQFVYTMDMDGNRAADGEDLRYRFGRDQGYGDRLVATFLDDRPCSILEMMVALAVRCEEHIMEDPDAGNRTGAWFQVMIDSLGLNKMTDQGFNLQYMDRVIDRFLDRTYSPDGSGSLFRIEHPYEDMRGVEIWYQMFAYLNDTVM